MLLRPNNAPPPQFWGAGLKRKLLLIMLPHYWRPEGLQ